MARCIPPSASTLKEQVPKKHVKISQIFKAAVSLALCLALFVGLISPQIVWAATDALSQTLVVSEDTVSSESLYDNAIDIQNISDDEIASEVTDGRDANTKFFRLTDGTTIAAVYEEPVHIKDATGTWQNIDYRLSDAEDGYENQSEYGTMRVKFSKNPKNGKLYTLKTDDGQIKWSLSGVKESKKDAKLSQKSEKSSKLDVNNVSGIVTYEDILPGVTLQYLVTEGKLKENIIFANKESAGPLQFELQTNKFDVTIENNIIYFNNGDGEAVFSMSAPYMIDNNGISSNKITLSLDGSKNHYTVTVTPDAEWLENAAYPVTVDPALGYIMYGANISNSPAISNSYVYSLDPDDAEANYGGVVVGRQSGSYENARGIFKFALPNNLTSADRVVAASLQLAVHNFQPQQSNLSVIVNAHQITSDVGVETATWNKLDGNYDPIVSDSQVVKLEHMAELGAENVPRVPFDITNMVRDWYRNGNNYGLALISDNENSSYKFVSFFSGNYTGATDSRLPALIIQYANSNGIENNLTYHSVGNSEVGTISVNDFNGNLVYTFDDVSTNGNLFPVTVSHIFDNSRRDRYRYYHSSCHVGYGFRLNLYERIIVGSLEDYPYQYLDADGTMHYFKEKDAAELIYVDEFYPNRVLKVNKNSSGTVTYYHLTDGSNIETRFTPDGYINYKIDTTNDAKVTFTYIPSTARIDKITDGAGKVIDLEYTTINEKAYLASITDPAGRKTTYTYSNEKLTLVTRPDGSYFRFTYDDNGCLWRVRAYDNSYYNILYYPETYDSTNSLMRVKSVEHIGTDGYDIGGKLTFVYGNGETTVTDRDGKSETLMFDDFGQTVSVRDHAGRGTFLKYNSPDVTKDVNPNQTSNTAAQKSKATQLAYTTKLQATVTNYISNPDFEDSTLTSWQATNSSQSGSGALSTAYKYDGSKSLKIQSTSNTGKVSYQQEVEGINTNFFQSFTISAYVKITDLVTSSAANVSGAVVYFGYTDLVGNSYETVGEPLQTISDDFIRISHTLAPEISVDKVYARVGLSNCTGIAYFDNVQVEKGSVANPYNYIDNGDFGDAIGATAPTAYTIANLSSTTDKIVNENNRNCFQITGVRSKYKRIEQVVNVSGNTGDRFTFSAWAKSTGALSKKGSLADEDRNFGLRIIFTDSEGAETRKFYDFEDKTGGWQFLAGEIIADRDYVSVKIAFIYYNQKNVAFVDDLCLFKEGSNISYTYDNWGRVKTVKNIDKDGDKKTTYTYEVAYSSDASVLPDNRIKSISYPDGTSESYTYDSAKRVLTHIDANGVKTTYNYDTNGNLTGTTVTENGNTESPILVGNTTAYTTDGNYASSVTDPFGNTTTSVINEQKGLVTSVTDPYNVVTDYTYDANNDRLTSVESCYTQVNYGYNTSGLLSQINYGAQSAEGTTYLFEYNEVGRRTSTYVGDQELIGHIYDEYSGNLISDVYSTGFSKQYSYDSIDNLTEIKYNDVEKFNWSYDYMGRVGLHNDLENNQEFRYTYDSKGRVESVVSKPTATGFSKSTFKNTFNAKDQLEAVSRKIGGITLNATYTYSDGGRLQKEQYTDNSALNYTYDELGRVRQKTVSTSANSAALQTNYTFSTTTNSQTTARVATESITTPDFLAAYEYQYDKNGNISQIEVDYGLHTDEFEYDDLNQLTYAVIDDVSFAYEYDMAGNIISKSGGIDEEYIEFLYTDENWKDLLTYYGEQEITYDQIGNPIDYRDGMYFTWQGRRLATANANGKSLSFKYNADGIRTQKTVNGVTTYFTLDGSKIISQKTGDTEIFFEYDATGNVATMIYNGETYHYIRNLMGEIIGLIDDDGVLVGRYYYDPWGEITGADSFTSQNIAGINPFRYKGYYYDSETGFYYLNSRYYDPEICRFINADGFVSTGQGILGANMFAYCGNNPINRIDSNGEFWGALVQIAAVVIVAVVAKNHIIARRNYNHNSKVDNDPKTTTKNTIINDQNEDTGENFTYGRYPASYNACETIAVHNAKVLKGVDSTLSETMYDFQMSGAMPLYGVFGSNPYAIGSVLKKSGIKSARVGLDEMTQSGTYIISYWTGDPFGSTIHTVAVSYDGENYSTYNLKGNGKVYTYNPMTYASNYICGYYCG